MKKASPVRLANNRSKEVREAFATRVEGLCPEYADEKCPSEIRSGQVVSCSRSLLDALSATLQDLRVHPRDSIFYRYLFFDASWERLYSPEQVAFLRGDNDEG